MMRQGMGRWLAFVQRLLERMERKVVGWAMAPQRWLKKFIISVLFRISVPIR